MSTATEQYKHSRPQNPCPGNTGFVGSAIMRLEIRRSSGKTCGADLPGGCVAGADHVDARAVRDRAHQHQNVTMGR